MRWFVVSFIILFLPVTLSAEVLVGLDLLFKKENAHLLKNKRVGLITNNNAIDIEGTTAFELFKKHAGSYNFDMIALFCPEHGFDGKSDAFEYIKDGIEKSGIPIYSLHGKTKRPTKKMLKNIDVLVFDIPCIGSRCYTYEATLFYAIEEAVKEDITFIILDRPNPINGLLISGPMQEKQFKSFFAHINIPFCHGMTMGELSHLFNEEYGIQCKLVVMKMQGWVRSMSFADTGLKWVSPSPNMKDIDTPLVYPITIILGESLELISIDLKGDRPFKVIGAPWIGEEFAKRLNERHLPGIEFYPTSFTPVWGKFSGEECTGVSLNVVDSKIFEPFLICQTLVQILKELYPKKMEEAFSLALKRGRKKICNYIMTNENFFDFLSKTGMKSEIQLNEIDQERREEFLELRQIYLMY